jgi:hypothetical protein
LKLTLWLERLTARQAKKRNLNKAKVIALELTERVDNGLLYSSQQKLYSTKAFFGQKQSTLIILGGRVQSTKLGHLHARD